MPSVMHRGLKDRLFLYYIESVCETYLILYVEILPYTDDHATMHAKETVIFQNLKKSIMSIFIAFTLHRRTIGALQTKVEAISVHEYIQMLR